MAHELGADWRARIVEFDEVPFAAASIGQVHRARLATGEVVAIKVQYPGVSESINSDIDNLWTLLTLSNMVPKGFFFDRMLSNVGVTHFWTGIVKAPVLAIVIAAIGCRQGFEVGGDVEQLGRRVTTAVVQALFAIIVLDAIFALTFMELNI